MDRYVEITNPAKVRSNTNLVVAGFSANQSEWNKYSFYPNKGDVGILIGEAQCYEGLIYIVQCDNTIFVPVLPIGIRDISLSEFCNRYSQNHIVGKATAQQMNDSFNVDEFMDSLNKMFGL